MIFIFFCNPCRAALLPLRRRPLYPTELRGLIQKIFNFAGLQDSNDSIFRRRTLYPGEVRGHIQKLFSYTRLWDSNGSIVRRRGFYPVPLPDGWRFPAGPGGRDVGPAVSILPVFPHPVNGKGPPRFAAALAFTG